MADRGHCDLVRDVVSDLPVAVLAEVLGMPDQDRGLLYDWANRVIGYQDPDYAGSDSFDPEHGTEMARAGTGPSTATRRRRCPTDPRTREGLADLYAYAHVRWPATAGRTPATTSSHCCSRPSTRAPVLSDEEFETLFFLFAVAGNETLRNAIPGAVLTLVENPDQYELLLSSPELLPAAVEEALRYWPPVIHFRRTQPVTRNWPGKPSPPATRSSSTTSPPTGPRGLRRSPPFRHHQNGQRSSVVRVRSPFLHRFPPGPPADAFDVVRAEHPARPAGAGSRTGAVAVEFPARPEVAPGSMAGRMTDPHGPPRRFLIHGLGATRGVWSDLQSVLSWDGRVVATDLPGHGAAGWSGDYTIGALAAAISAHCENGERVIVVGHSLGGGVGLALASGMFRPAVAGAVAVGVKVGWTAQDVETFAAVAAKGCASGSTPETRPSTGSSASPAWPVWSIRIIRQPSTP